MQNAEKKGVFARTGSCFGDPETNALKALHDRNLGLFLDAINEVQDPEKAKNDESHWINKPVPEDRGNSLLIRAIKDNLPDFVGELLVAGANANSFNLDLGVYPIHVAAQCKHLECLKLLFKFEGNKADPNVKMKSNGKTALNCCTQNGFEEGLDFLLRLPQIDVNAKDMRNCPPLYYAVKNGNLSMARKLVVHGGDFNQVCFGKPIYPKLMEEKLPGFNPTLIGRQRAPLANQVSQASYEQIAIILEKAAIDEELHDLDFKVFKDLILQLDSDEINSHEWNGMTLLQKAVDCGITEYVQEVLSLPNSNPNSITLSAPIAPLLMAANRQDLEIIILLVKFGADITIVAKESAETLLHVLLKRGDWSDNSLECLQHILWNADLDVNIRKIVNKRDILENTALHYAAQSWPQEIVRRLLELGANIGMKNHWDETPIEKIHPHVLESFLDEECIKATGDVNHENFEMTFDYSFLAPPIEDLPFVVQGKVKKQDLEALDPTEEGKVALPETTSLWFLGQSKEHRHLLKHPIVTSFLYLKWQRIRRYFNRNLRFYLLLVFILTWYIFEQFGGESLRDESTRSIPLWDTAFLVFTLVLICFILRDWSMDIKDMIKSELMEAKTRTCGNMISNLFLANWVEAVFAVFMVSLIFVGSQYLWLYLMVLTLILLFRELFQVSVSLKRYLVSPENWLEVSMIVMIGLILSLDGSDYSTDLKRHLSAITIVLSWAELITLIGRHPKLTRCNVYVTMFYKVMGTFFFFLCWYLFFLVAFGLGFYIILHKDGPNDTVGPNDYVFFNRPWLALVKTSTMFVGEIEFANIPVNLESPLSPLGYLFFLSFVFLMVVVLMNLLNGLAVSDTGIIQEKAEIYTYMSQVDTISYTESILLGDPFDFLSNWPKLKFLLDIPSCSLCSYMYKNNFVQKLFHKVTGGSAILLFYNVLPSKKLKFRPNERTRDCNILSTKLMDPKIISSAKGVVLKQRAKKTDDHVTSLEKKFDSRMDSLEAKLDTLMEKLYKL